MDSTQITPIDILNNIDQLYNNAWSSIIFVFTALLGLVGVVVPLVIQRIQSKRIDDAETDLYKRIKSELLIENQKHLNDLKDKYDEKLKSIIDEFESKNAVNFRIIKARIFHVQATTSPYPVLAIPSFIEAISGYLDSMDEAINIQACLNGISSSLDKLNSDDIEKLKDQDTDIESFTASISKRDDAGHYYHKLSEITSKYKEASKRKAEDT